MRALPRPQKARTFRGSDSPHNPPTMTPEIRPYDRAEAFAARLSDLAPMPLPTRVLMASPEHFRVAYVINPHMAENVGTVDAGAAQAQWEAIRAAYERLGVAVDVLEADPEFPDLVFCANQTLPFVETVNLGEEPRYGVVLSRMHAEQRRGEVELLCAHFAGRGYDLYTLPTELTGSFEGMGDALWHPGRRLLWGGYGFRTDRRVYAHLAEVTGAPVLKLRLDDPDFYHLDTCLALLREDAALWYPGAFDAEGRALLESVIPTLLEVPEDEARHLFACNAHCPDGEHVLIQEGCEATEELLRTNGFTPVPLDTSEYLKAGGSVFCMKLPLWA